MKAVKFKDICCPYCKSHNFREHYATSTLIFSPCRIVDGKRVINDVNTYTYDVVCNKCNKPFQFIKSGDTYFVESDDLLDIKISKYDYYKLSNGNTIFFINRDKQSLDRKYKISDIIKINGQYWNIENIVKFNYGEYGDSPLISFICTPKTVN